MPEQMELSCSLGVRGRQRYVLSDTTLDWTYSTFWSLFERSIPLETFDPNPVHRKTRPVKSIVGAVLFFVLGGLLVAASFDPMLRGDVSVQIVAMILLLVGMVFVMRIFLCGTNYLIFNFQARYASLSLFFPFGKPDRPTFAAFVDEFRARIERRREEAGLVRLEPEVAELNYLLKSGRITAAQLRRIRDEVLGEGPPEA